MKVTIAWSFTSASPYAFMTWNLIKHDTLPGILLPQCYLLCPLLPKH